MQKLGRMNCLVLPSHEEGFGRVIIEMLSLGRPVISTRSGGPEYIVNKTNGLIVEPCDVLGLVHALYSVYQNYKVYDENTIKQYFENNFSIDKNTRLLIEKLHKE